MEYDSALKRKEVLTDSTTRMSLQDIMLSEINQSQKDNYCMIPLLRGTWSNQNHRDRKQSGGYQGLGDEKWGVSV